MPYRLFHDLFPEIAERETRTITILPDSPFNLPSAQYALCEMFCNEPECDCRRVMFYIVSSRKHAVEAIVAYGWESPEFYREWMGDDDPHVIDALLGPCLNLGSPQSSNAQAILDLVRKVALSDPSYVERIKLHYTMFRKKIEEADAETKIR
jgi:hypothetical protein